MSVPASGQNYISMAIQYMNTLPKAERESMTCQDLKKIADAFEEAAKELQEAASLPSSPILQRAQSSQGG